LLALERDYGSFTAYLRSFHSYGECSADLKRRFRFLGEVSVYYLLFLVGERVPPFEEWERTVPGDHPRMREMVALARSEDAR
jgi:3-methyladenine DNA glycosylase Tag